MKKVFLLLSAMGLLIGLSQCTKPEVQEIAGSQTLTQTITLTADLGDGSKVSFTEPNPATGQLDLAWESGDRIKVYEGSNPTPVGDLARVSGNYWSSSYDYGGRAYGLRFLSGRVDPQDFNYRYYGQSVRLVR